MNDVVSIIMPAYNCGEFIGKSVESVINQTYPHWELFVTDDCSDDNTYEEVSKYTKNDARIKYIKSEKNAGAAAARNTGTEAATGKYIAFLDSDDLWYKDKLEMQLKFMDENSYNITCTSYEHINEIGEPLNTVKTARTKTDYNKMLLANPVGNSTVIYNAENLGKCYAPDIRKRNDMALWLKLLKKEKYIYGYAQILMSYRVRQNSISRNRLSLIKYHWILYRKIENLSVPRAVFHICAWCIFKILKI